MSRLGNKPVELPEGVEVTLQDNVMTVKGPKGVLTQSYSTDVKITIEDKQVVLEGSGESRQSKANHGLYRSLLSNMVVGVSKGFVKDLILEGVGYRVIATGNKLVFSLGFCHVIDYYVHPEVKVSVDGNTKLKLECYDKQLLGQVAAEVRSLRKPEPYKGKGIRYSDEVIRKKIGKAASK